VRGGEEREWRARSEIGEQSEEGPCTGEEDCGFAEAEISGFDSGRGEEIWYLKQLPEEDTGEQDAYSPMRCGAEEEAEASGDFKCCGEVGKRSAGGEPGSDGLPDECEVAIDEAEDADAEESDGAECEGWLIGCLKEGDARGLAGDLECGLRCANRLGH